MKKFKATEISACVQRNVRNHTYVSLDGDESRVCGKHSENWCQKTLENVQFLVPSPRQFHLLINNWYSEAKAEVGWIAKNLPDLKWRSQCSGK